MKRHKGKGQNGIQELIGELHYVLMRVTTQPYTGGERSAGNGDNKFATTTYFFAKRDNAHTVFLTPARGTFMYKKLISASKCKTRL